MDKKGILISFLFIAFISAVSLYGFLTIPAGTQIPSHFDINGNVDDTADRNILLIGMPLLAILLSLVFSLIPAIDPRRRNVEHSKGLFYAGWFGALSILALIYCMIVFSAVHKTTPDFRWVLIGASLLIIIIGNYMAKSRSSWFLGLRTPWTLTSEHSWVVANRLCGWLFVLTGVFSIALSFLHTKEASFLILVGGLLLSVLAGIIISFVAWRNDPARNISAE